MLVERKKKKKRRTERVSISPLSSFFSFSFWSPATTLAAPVAPEQDKSMSRCRRSRGRERHKSVTMLLLLLLVLLPAFCFSFVSISSCVSAEAVSSDIEEYEYETRFHSTSTALATNRDTKTRQEAIGEGGTGSDGGGGGGGGGDGDGEDDAPPSQQSVMQLSVLVETVDGNIHAIDALSGEKLWKTKSGGGSLVTASGNMKVASSFEEKIKAAIVPGVDGHLYSIKPGSKAIQKMGVQASDVIMVTPNVAGDGSVVLGSKKDTVLLIHPLTGEVLSRVSGSEPEEMSESFNKASLMLRQPNDNDPGDAIKVASNLQPLLLSTTKYVIKALDHKYKEELWNISYTDVKQMSAAEGSTLLGISQLDESSAKEDSYLKQFMQVANSLKVVTTADNTIRVANTMYKWDRLWSEKLDSTPVFASVSDSMSGHVHNIKLWSSEEQKEDAEGNILVGIHADGIFIMPALKEEAGFGELPKLDFDDSTDAKGNALAVPSDVGSRLSNALRSRERDNALVPIPLEDGKPDKESLNPLPLVAFDSKGIGKDKDKSKEEFTLEDLPQDLLDKYIESYMASTQSKAAAYNPWLTTFVSVVLAVGFVFAGYFYESYMSMLKDNKQMMQKGGSLLGDTMTTSISNRRKLANEEIQLGKLIISPKILGYGSGGTIVFEGRFDRRDVAVKRLLREFYQMADKEIRTLVASDMHPSVVRCFGMEEDEEFIYVALEKCEETLEDYIASEDYGKALTAAIEESPAQEVSSKRVLPGSKQRVFNKVARIKVPSQMYEMLWDISEALASLHSKGIVHRDLKPQNVLLTQFKKAKVSDMGLSKQLLAEQSSFDGTGMGSPGWQAPEVLSQKQQYLNRMKGSDISSLDGDRTESSEWKDGKNSDTSNSTNTSNSALRISLRHTRAVDVFSLGCIIFYTLTRHHPFGAPIERDNNILRGKFDLKYISLLRMLLQEDEEDKKGVPSEVKSKDESKDNKSESKSGPKAKKGKRGKRKKEESAEEGDESKNTAKKVAGKGDKSTKKDKAEGETDESATADDGKSEDREASVQNSEDAPMSWKSVVAKRRSTLDSEAKQKAAAASKKSSAQNSSAQSRQERVFAQDPNGRVQNIAYVSWFEANNLVYAMIHSDPRLRPTMKAVLAHPFWWSFQKRIQFIMDLSHRMEKEDQVTDPTLLSFMELFGEMALNSSSWFTQIDEVVWNHSKKFRNYQTDSVKDLTRFIRNKVSHYRDASKEVLEIIGSCPDGVYTYFATVFPKLFMCLYSFTCRHLKTDPFMQKYFQDGVQPEDMECFCMRPSRALVASQYCGQDHKLKELVHPVRPGQPECEFFARTGFCRYGTDCRFDHPLKYAVAKNSAGYPIRPNKTNCEFFVKEGKCKFGQSCRFNHPEEYCYSKQKKLRESGTLAKTKGGSRW